MSFLLANFYLIFNNRRTQLYPEPWVISDVHIAHWVGLSTSDFNDFMKLYLLMQILDGELLDEPLWHVVILEVLPWGFREEKRLRV